ncbi:ABC transporter ATP-binding protein [Oscillatoria sp. FACHB-1406]|uniref:ABC transporter ATP-binding protein n=1 Tax=Oscillatoria sp. FACHB-1406 TaxID=2692846 RepID=UPI0016866152|nr:ABC transporter ATP-binding protein [Oscillatoria sp. FACHB-1406]MBD2576264.1 ABC transporter ATP-binding protein [Oscillatoria sp. FACHB-1406]
MKLRNLSFSAFRYSPRAIGLVWQTSRFLTVLLALFTILEGILPAAIAYTGKLIVDAVVAASQGGDASPALRYVTFEAIFVILQAAAQRSSSVVQFILRALLGHKVNVLILEKALTLNLAHFEDSEFYDKLTRARNEASFRPLTFILRISSLAENVLALISYSGLLLQFSVLAVLVLVAAAIPPFLAETRFAGKAFRLFQWRSPDTREQNYLEVVLAREDYAKEVQLYQLGPLFLSRYRGIFQRLFSEDRSLFLRRGFWGFILGLLGTGIFYLAYLWIVLETMKGKISLGDMTMYLMVFRQGQSTLSRLLNSVSGLYEDNLYLSNLFEFLDQKIPKALGIVKQGSIPNDGIRFENVSFTYPGSESTALNNLSFHLKPGEKLAIVGKNGSGKTTLIKLLGRLYEPTQGRILLDGLDVQDWDLQVLHQRISVIFQDFARYQFPVGENIGVGDVQHLENTERWDSAATKGMAKPFIETMPQGFQTQLGRWFKSGVELSGGQWQKIALSRAFMRESADILVLDEPTAAMDAEAEAEMFSRLLELANRQMVFLISHRFSTVRMADWIIVLENGEILEQGTHESLLEQRGRYQHLFSLQAAGYQ